MDLRLSLTEGRYVFPSFSRLRALSRVVDSSRMQSSSSLPLLFSQILEEESPSGMLARSGSYLVRSRLTDDDGIVCEFSRLFSLRPSLSHQTRD